MRLLQQVRGELAHHSRRDPTEDVCQENSLFLKKNVCVGGRGGEGVQNDTQEMGFVSLPACLCRVRKRLQPRLPACSVAAVSAAARAMEPHGGQPCKEHKRPI